MRDIQREMQRDRDSDKKRKKQMRREVRVRLTGQEKNRREQVGHLRSVFAGISVVGKEKCRWVLLAPAYSVPRWWTFELYSSMHGHLILAPVEKIVN